MFRLRYGLLESYSNQPPPARTARQRDPAAAGLDNAAAVPAAAHDLDNAAATPAAAPVVVGLQKR